MNGWMRYAWLALLLPARISGADGMSRPGFEARLCSSFDENLQPQGETRVFRTDSSQVCALYVTEAAVAAGARLQPRIRTEAGEVVVAAPPFVADGKSNLFATRFRIAGQEWARSAGRFRLEVLWNNDDDPLFSLPFEVTSSDRWALLIGIEDYPPAGDENNLPGCRMDVERMERMLTGPFGFPAGHVTRLLDLDATHANIEKALADLAERAGPDDAVVVYYSGHGSQVPDLDGDEGDGWDEAISPADPLPPVVTTEEEMNRLITDDRLAQLLSAFRTSNVTVIFDSCHSGTALRGAEEQTPPPWLYSGKQRELAFGRDLMEKADQARLSAATRPGRRSWEADGRFVFLAAARSWEMSGCNPLLGGFFTNFLIPAIENSRGESWEEIAAGVRTTILGFSPGQSPGAEGATRRFPFSLAETKADAPYVRPSIAAVGATPAGAAPAAEVLPKGDAGTHRAVLSGLASLYHEQRGALYAVYASGDDTFAGAPKGKVQLTGEIQIVKEAPLTAGLIQEGIVEQGDRLVPMTVRIPHARPVVAMNISPGAPADAMPKIAAAATALSQALSGDAAVEWRTSGAWSDMDYVVEPRWSNDRVLDYIWSTAGVCVAVYQGDDATAAAGVRDLILDRHNSFTRVMRLSNPSAPFRFSVRVGGGEESLQPGREVEVTTLAEQDAHVVAILVTEKGGLLVAAETTAPVKAGTPYSFRYKVPERAQGRMALKVLALTRPVDLAAFRKSKPVERAPALFEALGKVYDGGSPDFLTTSGWADGAVVR